MSADLEAIKGQAINNYSGGGLPAVDFMIFDLAGVATGAQALADGSSIILTEAIRNQDDMLPEEVRAAVAQDHDAQLDHTTAMSEHSFAMWLHGVLSELES